jgi:putative peptidoglycan lipid II flippase
VLFRSLHENAGLLLGAALVVGNSVAGGVVAYQVAFVFFLAPYAVLAQPIHTAILPELANEAKRDDVDAFARSISWTLDRMAVLIVPVSVALFVCALPLMQMVAFGRAAHNGPELLAAALAWLAVGLFPYAALLLFARAFYALHDSRTPAIVAIGSALVGVATMVALVPVTHGAARVAALGIGHSTGYTVGALVLGGLLRRRLGRSFVPRGLYVAIAWSIPLGAALWLAIRAIDPEGRLATFAVLAGLGAIAAAVYVLSVRRWWPAPPVTGTLVDA